MLAAFVVMPGLLAFLTRAGLTLEDVGLDEVIFDCTEGRVDFAILNGSPTDRITAVTDHAFSGVVCNMSVYDSENRDQYL